MFEDKFSIWDCIQIFIKERNGTEALLRDGVVLIRFIRLCVWLFRMNLYVSPKSLCVMCEWWVGYFSQKIQERWFQSFISTKISTFRCFIRSVSSSGSTDHKLFHRFISCRVWFFVICDGMYDCVWWCVIDGLCQKVHSRRTCWQRYICINRRNIDISLLGRTCLCIVGPTEWMKRAMYRWMQEETKSNIEFPGTWCSWEVVMEKLFCYYVHTSAYDIRQTTN